ncbi:bifunctional DNA primase/polymerase [Caldibacillus lycopersici]|uniref:Bifunctional DNA primase/polymerase n=1 Tax=Perspicuibacillus lycopersici TaxID=1325689 RepID=A0AAE3LPW3_9BACI|nr:bifunctional DNA primase/polymerase [Perspicuibacillus lycopersici]MCU9612744.1 bifunctional DNA primase/polymerase [Perspicuibacillus lycopersici]
MDKSVLAALQLFQYGLTPIPLYQKKPLIQNWSKRFMENPLTQEEILNGIYSPNGHTIRYDQRNIGIITGKVSNCIVLDIDDLSLFKKLQMMGPLPHTWKVQSNRGIHLYFNYDEQVSSMKLWGGIDVLSDYKQVVAPPSIHPSGKQYKWIISPKDTNKADLPNWLLAYLVNDKQHKIAEEKNLNITKKRIKLSDFETLLNNIDWISFYSKITSNIRGNGEWLSSKCPFHQDQHNSFSFNRKNGAWICFAGCGSGNSIILLQKLFNITFSQALQLLKGRDIYV